MTLTDRYLGATLRRIPADKRDDIDRELRGSIADAVDARIDSGIDPAAAEVEVLTELGDPDRLAADYSGAPLYLIGPNLYLEWRRLLAILLWIAPIPGVVVLVLDIFDGAPTGEAIGSGITTAMMVALQILFWTTVVFAALERYGQRGDLTGPWTPDKLPEIDDSRRISLCDTVASIAIYVFLIAVAILQRTRSGITADDGTRIPIFADDLWSFWMPALLVLLGLSIVFEIVKFGIGRWSVTLATINTVLGVAFAVPLVWLAATDRLWDDRYFPTAFGDDDAARIASAAVVLGTIAVTAWDIGEGWIKARRSVSSVPAQ